MKYLRILAMIILCCGLTSCAGEAEFFSNLSKAASVIQIHTFGTFIKVAFLFALLSLIIQFVLSEFGLPFPALIAWLIIASLLIFMIDKMGFLMKTGLISSFLVLSRVIDIGLLFIWIRIRSLFK